MSEVLKSKTVQNISSRFTRVAQNLKKLQVCSEEVRVPKGVAHMHDKPKRVDSIYQMEENVVSERPTVHSVVLRLAMENIMSG